MFFFLIYLFFTDLGLQKYMVAKKGRYKINMDVLLFPWKLTYKNPGPGLVPKGSFGKVHLAQDTATRKRMACKLVSLLSNDWNPACAHFSKLLSYVPNTSPAKY